VKFVLIKFIVGCVIKFSRFKVHRYCRV